MKVFTLGKINCVRFQNFFGSTPVRSVSLLITIIVSKAFMSKACMVVSGISCHCIWTNTDYYNNIKKVPPCLIKIFGNWPEKLKIVFVWPYVKVEWHRFAKTIVISMKPSTLLIFLSNFPVPLMVIYVQ
jgi:hypothetical protein